VGPLGGGNVCGSMAPMFAYTNTFLVMPSLSNIPLTEVTLDPNVIYLIPVYVPFARHYTAMAIAVVGSENVFKIGIYDCDQDMHPTVCLVETVPMNWTTTGVTQVPIDVMLSPKPYYLALWAGGEIRVEAFPGTYVVHTLGWRCNSSGWTQPVHNVTYAVTFNGGNFPDLTNNDLYTLNYAAVPDDSLLPSQFPQYPQPIIGIR
jgi:hypothetical protein